MHKHRDHERFLITDPVDGQRARHVLRILDEYREADDGQKLVMFLQYRELRAQFTSIDLEEESLH